MRSLIHKEPLDLHVWYALVGWLSQCHISVNFPHLFIYIYPEFVHVQKYINELLSFVLIA